MADADSRIISYADDDVDGPAITWARNLGVEIITSNDADIRGAYDSDHFEYAIEHGYILVTGNIKDFEPLFYAWLAMDHNHPGMVLIRARHRTSSGLIAEHLSIIQSAGKPEDMQNRIWRI